MNSADHQPTSTHHQIPIQPPTQHPTQSPIQLPAQHPPHPPTQLPTQLPTQTPNQPSKPPNQKDLLLRLLKISEQFNIDQKDLPALLIKSIIISLKYLDRRALFQSLFPSHYADWDLIDRCPATTNSLGDTEPWLSLLSLLEWPTLSDKDIDLSHPPLSQIKASLKSKNLDLPGWTMSCRVLILQLIQGLQSMHAIEQLTSRALSRNTHEDTMHFLASLCDSHHLPTTYSATLLHILSPGAVNIDSALLGHTMAIINAQREEHRLNLRLKTLQLATLRPRLRDRLKTSLLTEHNKEQVDSRLGTWDSYTGFCHTHRFPNNLSDRIKRQLYFLASQTHWDWRPHVPALIKTKDIETRVQSHPVTQPDPTILHQVIDTLSMDGRPPFPEMMAFKARCFNSFPVVYTQRLTLTQILRLYTAAYQPPSVWKDVWKAQIGIISPQIIRDCEAFVVANEFAGGKIVETLVA